MFPVRFPIVRREVVIDCTTMMPKIRMFIVRSSRSCGVRAAPFSFLSRFIFSISRTRFILSHVCVSLVCFFKKLVRRDFQRIRDPRDIARFKLLSTTQDA